MCKSPCYFFFRGITLQGLPVNGSHTGCGAGLRIGEDPLGKGEGLRDHQGVVEKEEGLGRRVSFAATTPNLHSVWQVEGDEFLRQCVA